MSARAGRWVGALALLVAAGVAAEPAPSLSHDWNAMTENERFCVVPSHQDNAECRWTGPSAAEAFRAYRHHQYDQAFAAFAAAARAGQTWGMSGEGVLYWFGDGVARDRSRAYGLTKAAGDLGDATAATLAQRMSSEMTGAELLHSEITTAEYVQLGSASNRTLLQWAAQQLGVTVDPAAARAVAAEPRCADRVPVIEHWAHIVESAPRMFPHFSIDGLKQGRSADVYVAGLIDREGKPCRAQVVDSLNATRRMGSDAVYAILTWTFQPPLHNGQPVQSLFLVKVQYRIRD